MEKSRNTTASSDQWNRFSGSRPLESAARIASRADAAAITSTSNQVGRLCSASKAKRRNSFKAVSVPMICRMTSRRNPRPMTIAAATQSRRVTFAMFSRTTPRWVAGRLPRSCPATSVDRSQAVSATTCSSSSLSEPVKKSSAGDRQAVVNMRSLSHEQRAFAVS